jgi:hypothetical protein
MLGFDGDGYIDVGLEREEGMVLVGREEVMFDWLGELKCIL